MASRYQKVDLRITRLMNRWGIPALRFSMAIIFFLFGILKPLGLSPAEGILKATVAWLPFWTPEFWLNLIGWWEVVIGITFLFKKTTRIAIALLFLQMVGTFIPLLVLPEVVYQEGYKIWLPTLEGQYIIKNLLIISAAFVVGGSMYRERYKELF